MNAIVRKGSHFVFVFGTLFLFMFSDVGKQQLVLFSWLGGRELLEARHHGEGERGVWGPSTVPGVVWEAL